tara:strand:- start:1670 stop:2611 length:942 start_codon:yes stop_codon:yes gene_type:complete
MAFLDNSGDIILDAVLTDTGRFRLAKGDGSFKIAKFALGDDEINYELYNRAHSSGSAYYDLEILRSPVLEAFTNNGSSMKSKLISIPRNNLLYLPIMELNESYSTDSARHSNGTFIVAVDETAELTFGQTGTGKALAPVQGIINGETLKGGSYIRVDQGLDTTEISPKFNIDSDLLETQYIIEVDNRLAKVASQGGTVATISYIDDDNIASYFLTLGTDPDFVSDNPDTSTSNRQSISGPRGTILEFVLQASVELNTSDYLFDTLGGEDTLAGQVSGTGNSSIDIKYIDSLLRVQGATTGASIDIPIRFVKKK